MAIEQQFKYGDQNQEKDKQTLGSAPQALGAQGAAAPSGGQTQQPQGQPQGTGQAFNIQKYLTANQGAGANIAQKAGQAITGQLDPAKEQASGRFTSLQQGIQAGQAKFGEGGQAGQFQTQLQGAAENIGQFDPTAFMQAPGYQDYQNILSGGAFDQQALAQQQSEAYMSQSEALKAAQERAAQLGSEQGRFGLMKELVGTNAAQYAPRYTTGQSRLGQLFMQTQAAPELAALQGQVQSQYIDPLTGQLSQTEAAREQIGSLTEQEAQAQRALQEATGGLYGKFQESIAPDLQAKVEAANKQREALQGDINVFQQVMSGQKALGEEGFDADAFRRGMEAAGMTGEQRLYGRQFQPTELGQVSQEIYDPNAFLGQQQADRWKAFAQLAGKEENIPGVGRYGDKGPQAFQAGDIGKLTSEKQSEIFGNLQKLPIDPRFGSGDAIIKDLQAGKSPQESLASIDSVINMSTEQMMKDPRFQGILATAGGVSNVGFAGANAREAAAKQIRNDAINNKNMIMNSLNTQGYGETVNSRLQQIANQRASTASDAAQRQAILDEMSRWSKGFGIPGAGGTQLGDKN